MNLSKLSDFEMLQLAALVRPIAKELHAAAAKKAAAGQAGPRPEYGAPQEENFALYKQEMADFSAKRPVSVFAREALQELIDIAGAVQQS